MSDTTFQPSAVFLGAPPLTATMKKAEREFAAALIVRACQVNGDEWKPVDIESLSKVLQSDIDEKREPFASLNRNPFFNPDFWLLADGAYGRWIGETGKSAIELTEQGVEALRRWVSL